MAITVLVVDDEKNFREEAMVFLTHSGFEVIGVPTMGELRKLVEQGIGDVILLDVMLPDGYGPNLLLELQENIFRPPVIIITAYPNLEMAVEAMKNGAQDFLSKPLDFSRMVLAVKRAEELVEMRRELLLSRQNRQAQMDFVAGKSSAMQQLLKDARRVAENSVSVIINGETGTGKEVLAHFIHQAGPRAKKQFVDVNSPGIQPTMIEAELFGAEPHAYTDAAAKRKTGLMEHADGGVLFFDEVAIMPMEMQVKLLRALEERSFRRLGGLQPVKVDVQLVAATNRDLSALIEAGSFRSDLFYRLHVVDLHVPPLRERKEDIPELVGFFVRRFNQEKGVRIMDVSPRAMAALVEYRWPGNIRELRNVLERAIIFCDDEVIDISHLPQDLVHPTR
jgi:two-component system, NtrC family, response regulator AtoC